MKAKRIAVLGYGESRKLAPLKDRQWQCWGMNDLHHYIDASKCSHWFQLHRREWLRTQWTEPLKPHLRWLRRWRKPVYVWHVADWPEVQGAVPYPKTDVERLTPHGHYHAWSFSWMTALAILQRPTEIAFFGLQGVQGEPEAARPCIEYWIGVAEGRGIKVHVEGTSALFRYSVSLTTDLQYGYAGFPNVVPATPYMDLIISSAGHTTEEWQAARDRLAGPEG